MNTTTEKPKSSAIAELLNRQLQPVYVIDFSQCETDADYDKVMAGAMAVLGIEKGGCDE